MAATSNTGSEIKICEDDKKGEDIKRGNKLIHLVAMLVSIVMLMAIVGCFVALFLEVVKLQSEASSFKNALTEQTPIIKERVRTSNILLLLKAAIETTAASFYLPGRLCWGANQLPFIFSESKVTVFASPTVPLSGVRIRILP